jgi:hypothetical protein
MMSAEHQAVVVAQIESLMVAGVERFGSVEKFQAALEAHNAG